MDIFGGCCGTGATHLREMASVLSRTRAVQSNTA
jgi:methionine synthase I (cobalamin-dependent)